MRARCAIKLLSSMAAPQNGQCICSYQSVYGRAESAGNPVIEFFLDRMDIYGCKGCLGRHSSKECPCVQKDDMAQIYPAVKECDVVVLASPLYYWTMNGRLKTDLDRLFALEEEEGNLLRGNGKSSALLMAAAGHGFDGVFTMTTYWSTYSGKIRAMSWPEKIWKLTISKERQKSSKPMRSESLIYQ